MSTEKAMAAVAITAAVTVFLRFFPFAVLRGKSELPPMIAFLGKVLPGAIMGMLVVFCLKDTDVTSIAGLAPSLIAGLLTVLLQVWKKKTLLSIIAGTACYMLLIQLVFV